MPKKAKRPKKPYPDFPLFFHATGQWAKKIKGRMHYFGTDPEVALQKYTNERDDLHAGRTPRLYAAGVPLRDVVNQFLESKKLLMRSGELSPRTWRDYYATCANLVDAFGKTRPVENLAGEDFTRLRAALAKTRGPVALGNEINRVRVVFNFAFKEGLIEKPVRFGSTFARPSRKVLRKARHAAGPRMIEAAELRKLAAAASVPLKAMILLGINCGFGQTDVANLPLAALDLKRGWVDFPRPKTEIPRHCPLWPETVQAIQEAIEARPDPRETADSGLAFITKYGNRWVRVRDRGEDKPGVAIDSVNLEFGKVLTAAGLNRKRLGFYALRHTFRTVADASKDQPAVDHIMGHGRDDMASLYRERIEDARLQTVVKLVRQWLRTNA